MMFIREQFDNEYKIEKMQVETLQNPNDIAKVYQKQYQEALKKQMSAFLDNLNSNKYDKIQIILKNVTRKVIRRHV